MRGRPLSLKSQILKARGYSTNKRKSAAMLAFEVKHGHNIEFLLTMGSEESVSAWLLLPISKVRAWKRALQVDDGKITFSPLMAPAPTAAQLERGYS